jgi:hypothetical protein
MFYYFSFVPMSHQYFYSPMLMPYQI